MAERYIPEHRRTQFKAKGAFASDVVRRRREEQQVEIRKAKREENLAKRRGIGTGENRPGASLGAAPDSDDDTAPTESQVRRRLALQSVLFDTLLGDRGSDLWSFLARATRPPPPPLRKGAATQSPLISMCFCGRRRAHIAPTHFNRFANPCDVTTPQEKQNAAPQNFFDDALLFGLFARLRSSQDADRP